MMKRLGIYLSVAFFALMTATALMPVVGGGTALAKTTQESLKEGYNAAGGSENTGKTGDLARLIRDVVNVLLYVLGAVAVIMIVLGGFKYVTSNGDQAQVTSAKNTILYSVIGLVVAILAYAIVNFVITSFEK